MSLFPMSRRGIENPGMPLTSNALLNLLGAPATDSGIHVSETDSLTMSTVWRAVALISGLGGALPLPAYTTGTRNKASNRLLDKPHPELTPYEFWRLNYVYRALWGNAYCQKIRDRGGQVRELHPIRPDRVKVGRGKESFKVFQVTDDGGKQHVFTEKDIFHVPGLGYDGLTGVSPIRMAAQGIGLALAAETYAAKLFGSGNLMSGILQTEQRLTEEQAISLQQRWSEKMSGLDRAHSVAVLDSGAVFQSLTMPNDDAQLLESRRFQVVEIARYFGVPPYLLMETEKSTSWGTGLEAQATGFIQFDLYPQWLAPTEQRITKELLPDSQFAKYNIDGLLRGDSQSRAEFYRVMREVGAYSPNDIRELEDRPPIPDGDSYLQPLNMVPLGTDMAKIQAQAQKQKNEGKSDNASQPSDD